MNRWGFVTRFVLLLVILGNEFPSSHAGISLRPAIPPLLLPDPLPERLPCEALPSPVTRAVLFGVSNYPSLDKTLQLEGAANDVRLLGTALSNLGVKDIEILSGRVERSVFVDRLQALASRSRCGDTVVVFFSGHGHFRDDSPLLVFSEIEGAEVLEMASSAKASSTDYPKTVHGPVHTRLLLRGTIDSSEIQIYFTWLREHGINVLFLLDAMYGQRMAGRQVNVGEETQTLWRPFLKPLSPVSAVDMGAFAGVYAEQSADQRLPVGDPKGKIFGWLSYAFATALLASREMDSFRTIAAKTAQGIRESVPFDQLQNVGLTFESSHPERSPLAVGLPGKRSTEVRLRGREDRRIEVTNPASQRGAVRVSGEILLIEGKVVAPNVPTAISANQTAGKVHPDGSFSVRLPIQRGENKVALVAWWGDSDFLPKPFTVVSSEGDHVMQEGKRYALIIANQDYKDGEYGRLATPLADAAALAERLERKFDFKTAAQVGGQAVSLVLKNATKADMDRAFSRLRKILTPADSVLVFYAGHGIYEKETDQAYWLPVDAEAGEPQTWVSAHDVQAAIQRLEVRHVLVVADSCFSGGFRRRGGDVEDKSAMSRVQFLTNSMTRASRTFISSGDNEPVADGGGRGHSLFARSLLDALDKENKPFTAGELFQAHIKAMVVGKSGQSPQYFPMKEGHAGGEFVFFPVAVLGR